MRRGAAVVAGLLLVAMGTAMVVVAITGESLYYVRDTMTWPLIVSGAVVAALGAAAATGWVEPAHAPRSVAFLAVAVFFVLYVRPGPLSVETGLIYDADAGGQVTKRVEIPPTAFVGASADAGRIDDAAVTLHAGQVWFAVQQFPERLDQVAIRMVGQFDTDDDGDVHLVRFRVSCCAADALRLAIPLDVPTSQIDGFEPGDWVELTGQWNGDVDEPGVVVSRIGPIPAPDRPYLTVDDG